MSARTHKPHSWPTRVDRAGSYVWAKQKTFNGVMTREGQPVDNSQFSTRRLQLLLNERWIAPAELFRPKGKAAIAAAHAAQARRDAAASADGLHVKHAGSGRWVVVDADDERKSDLGTKEEAQGWLDELRAAAAAG